MFSVRQFVDSEVVGLFDAVIDAMVDRMIFKDNEFKNHSLAVLIFLPGISEIESLHKHLQKRNEHL